MTSWPFSSASASAALCSSAARRARVGAADAPSANTRRRSSGGSSGATVSNVQKSFSRNVREAALDLEGGVLALEGGEGFVERAAPLADGFGEQRDQFGGEGAGVRVSSARR